MIWFILSPLKTLAVHFATANKCDSYNSNGFYCWDTSAWVQQFTSQHICVCAAGNHSANAFVQGDLNVQQQNRMKNLNSNLLILQNTAMPQKDGISYSRVHTETSSLINHLLETDHHSDPSHTWYSISHSQVTTNMQIVSDPVCTAILLYILVTNRI